MIPFVARNSLTNLYICIYRVSLILVHVCICDSWVEPKFKIFYRPLPSGGKAENIDVCINMGPSMLTDNKKRRKKKLATILCPVIIMLVESRFIFTCNITPPPLSFGRLLIHTWSFFRNSRHKTNSLIITQYSRRSLKLLLFLDSGVWRNL